MFSWRVITDPVDGGHLVVQTMEPPDQPDPERLVRLKGTVLCRCRDEGVAERICEALAEKYERSKG